MPATACSTAASAAAAPPALLAWPSQLTQRPTLMASCPCGLQGLEFSGPAAATAFAAGVTSTGCHPLKLATFCAVDMRRTAVVMSSLLSSPTCSVSSAGFKPSCYM